MPISYLDFELEVSPGSGRDHPVAVVRSPAGEARETMRFPFDELALENRLQALQIALLRSGGKRRKTALPEEQTVQDFGQTLFDALFAGEVRSRYDVSLREAVGQGKGLRLKLRIQAPGLAALPWEFLYDARQGAYICLSRHTPLVRYLELPQPPQPLTATPPLRILGLVVSPRDLPALDITRERQRVEEALKALREQGVVELTWLTGQTWRDLQRAMRSGPWHVFHFIGHGGFDRNADEGLIALADEEGLTRRLSATQLGLLLADHRSLRLAVLNACEGARGGERDIFSSTAAILVRGGISAVLAMQYEITDRAAIEFARAFYEAVADEMPVDAAVAEARKAVSLEVANTVEWGTPVLYMRSPDGVLFRLVQKPVVEPKPLPREVEQQAQQLAEAAQQRMVEVKQGLEALMPWVGAAWAQAWEQEAAAERAWQGQDYARAAEHYARASQLYEAARQEAEERRLRECASEARQQATHAQGAAEQEEAPRYAQELYQQAVAAQEQGEQSFAAQRWAEAAAAFDQAQTLFAQALQGGQNEKARGVAAAAFQRMGQARARAEQGGARERFPTEFAQARHLAGQGHASEEQEEFVQAVSLYERAEQLFVHLYRQVTVQAAQEGAEAARRRMRAVKERVSTLRPWAEALWAEAQEGETQAEQVYEAQAYERAVQAYERAAQAYEQVGVAGEREQLRHEALQARQQTLAARGDAERAEAVQYAAALFGQGSGAQEEADRKLQAQEFAEAIPEYRRAQGAFAQATQEAERERARRRAEAARQRMEAVKQGLEALTQWVGVKWTEAKEQEAVAAQAWQAQDYGQAAEHYERASRLYEAARGEAEEERHRQHALEANQQAAHAQIAAAQAEALQYAQDLYQQALAAKRQAEQSLATQRWEEAAEKFGQALVLFTQACQRSDREKAKQAAAAAFQRLAEAQAQAEQAGADKRFAAEFARVQGLVAQGQECEARADFVQAVGFYEQAAQQFVHLGRQATEHTAWEEAEAARRQAGAARAEAEQAGAERYAAELFNQARAAQEEADQRWQAQQFVEAAQGYRQTQELFQQALREAQREQARQAAVALQAARERAEAARRRMEEVKQRLEIVLQWAGASLQKATEQEAAAVQASAAQNYERASELFAQALQSYAAARVEAEEEQERQRAVQEQRERVEQAKIRAQESQRKAFTGGGWSLSIWWQRRQARGALIRGNRLFQQRKYVEAQASYEQAASLFAALQPPVEQEGVSVSRRSPWFSFSMDLSLWKRSHIALVLSFGCLAIIFVQILRSLDFSQPLQPPLTQEIPQLTEKPSAKLPEPHVPSTPSPQKPPIASRTQEPEGSEKSPVSPPQVVTKTPPEPEPSVSKLPADVRQTPPPPSKETPATKATEKPVASTGGQGTKSEKELPVYSVQTVTKPTPEPSASSKPAKDVAKVSPPSAREVPPQKPQEEPAVTRPLETAKVSPPEPPSRPSPRVISEAEVTAWLETYRRAWEEKDIDKLVQLGGVPAQQANEVRKGLSTFGSFRVIFKDVDIRREGARATVSFTRVDTIDGRDLIHPDRKVLIIEKQGGSLVSRQP